MRKALYLAGLLITLIATVCVSGASALWFNEQRIPKALRH